MVLYNDNNGELLFFKKKGKLAVLSDMHHVLNH